MQSMSWLRRTMRLGILLSLVLLDGLPAVAGAAVKPTAHKAPWVLVRTAKRRTRSASTTRAARNTGGMVYPNGETYAQRERRLRRECRGLPNAGACRGYTD